MGDPCNCDWGAPHGDPCRTSLRKAAAVAVTEWIVEMRGEETAQTWAWECTPMPCGLPTDEQLAEGLAVALGDLSIGALLDKCYREMDEAFQAYKAAHPEDFGAEPHRSKE